VENKIVFMILAILLVYLIFTAKGQELIKKISGYVGSVATIPNASSPNGTGGGNSSGNSDGGGGGGYGTF
jgi:hypothetical protein